MKTDGRVIVLPARAETSPNSREEVLSEPLGRARLSCSVGAGGRGGGIGAWIRRPVAPS